MDRKAALAPEADQPKKWQEAQATLEGYHRFATGEVGGKEIPGELDQVVHDVDHILGDPNLHPGVQALLNYVQGQSDRVTGKTGGPLLFRRTDVIMTANGAKERAAMLESGIKGSEEVRLPYTRLPLNVLLGNGYSAEAGRRTAWKSPVNYNATAGAVSANLNWYTEGALPNIPTELPSEKTVLDEIVLIGRGMDVPAMKFIAEKFKATSKVPIRFTTYEDALSLRLLDPKPGSLVVAVQPETSTHVGYLKELDEKGYWLVVSNADAVGKTPGINELKNVVRVQGEKSVALLAHMTVLELLFLDMARKRKELSEQDVQNEIAGLSRQVEGIKAVVRSMQENSGHGNRRARQRLLDYMRNRGWPNFSTWVLGKGTLEAVSDVCAPALGAALGRSAISNDPNILSHGLYGGMHFGDLVIAHVPPRSAPTYGDTKKKVFDEVPSRASNNPGGLWKQEEPGMIVAIAQETELEGTGSNEIIQPLSDDAYTRLRRMRREGIEREGGMHTYRADITFTTPNGGELERVVLQWLLVDEVASAQAADVQSQDETGRDKLRSGKIIIVLSSGETHRWPEEPAMYEELRRRYPQGDNLILAVTPGKKGDAPPPWADAAIQIPRGEPILMTKVGQVLAFVLAHARFSSWNEWIARLYDVLSQEIAKEANSLFASEDLLGGNFPPFLKDPAEIIGTYTVQPHRTDREEFRTAQTRTAVEFFERNFEGGQYLKSGNSIAQMILRAEQEANLFVPSLIGLRTPGAMLRAEMDRVWRLAKIVTNFGAVSMAAGYRRMAPVTLLSLKIGDIRTDEQVGQPREEGKASLSRDETAVTTLRGILGLPESISADEVIQQYLAKAIESLEALRDRLKKAYPSLPDETILAVHLGGAAFAHRTDKQLSLDVHFLLNLDLAWMQLEDEALHELVGGEAVPSTISVKEGVWDAAKEAYNLCQQARYFASLSTEGKTAMLQFLKDPNNPVDPERQFHAFLNNPQPTPLELFKKALQYIASDTLYATETQKSARELALLGHDLGTIYRALEVLYLKIADGRAPVIAVAPASAGLEEATFNPGAEPAAEVEQAAQERGWRWDAKMRLFLTPQKGWVSPEAVLGFAAKEDEKTGTKSWASVKNGALVRGATTRVAAAAVIDASLIEDADIRGGSITGAIVRTDRSLADDWSWSGTYKVDRVAQTVIGENAIIGRGVDGEPAEIVNATIGAWSYVYGGSIRNSQIGQKNRIVRAKVGLTHTEDNVTIETKNGAPTELSECWIGWGRTIDTESYNEQLSPNLIRRAWVDQNGDLHFVTVQDIPAVVIQGFSTIDASYDGTGKPGKEFTSSRHGKGVKFPGSIMGPRVTTIWRVHPDFENPEDFFRAESLDRKTPYAQLTALHPFSYSVKENPEDASGEVWGLVAPGSARRGLSSKLSDPLWVFKNAGRAINEILTEMRKQVELHAQIAGWDAKRKAEALWQIDQLPRYALETGKAIAHLEKNANLEEQYDIQLAQLAENGVKVKDEGFSLAELTATDDPTQHDWKDKQLLTQQDLADLDGLPEGIEISPDSVIGRDVKIIGARARLNGVHIPDGATVFVWGSVVEGTYLADGAEVRSSVLRGDPKERILVERGAKLTAVEAIRSSEERSLPVQFHEGVKATHAVVDSSVMGAKTTLEPYARIKDTGIGRNGAVGSIVEGSVFGDSITSHHLAGTRVYHVRTPNIPDPNPMSPLELDNLTNLSSGSRYFGTPENPIKLITTMTAANLLVRDGVTTGFGSFVKEEIPANTNIPPFGFWQGKKPGSAPAAMTKKLVSYIMRMVLGKTIKATPHEQRPVVNRVMGKALKDAGLNDELDGRWQMAFEQGKDQPTFPKGAWQYKPLYDGEKEGNGTYQWVPALAAAPAQPGAGLEEGDWAGLKEEGFLLPEAVSQKADVGVIAVGLEEPEVLALGVALSHVKTPVGQVPVAFVVQTRDQKAGLEELGVASAQIFQVGLEETPTVEAAVEAASLWLKEVWGMKVVELIRRVDQTIQLILHNLFGIELSRAEAGIWQSFIERVTGALASAA